MRMVNRFHIFSYMVMSKISAFFNSFFLFVLQIVYFSSDSNLNKFCRSEPYDHTIRFRNADGIF